MTQGFGETSKHEEETAMEDGNGEISDISDIGINTIEDLVKKFTKGNVGALKALMEHPDLLYLLRILGIWAEVRFQQNREEIRQVMWIKIPLKIHTIQHPERFRSWCYKVVRNYCLNEIRRQKLELAYLERLKEQQLDGNKRAGKPRNQLSAILTPEDEYLRHAGVERAAKRFPKQEWLRKAWEDGKSAKEISKELGKPKKTVYRWLKEMERAIIDETGLQPDEKSK
jgi:RNA polymerase sigma factor (sigma-70 family)